MGSISPMMDALRKRLGLRLSAGIAGARVYETERNPQWVGGRVPRWRFESRQLPKSGAKAI